MTSNSLEDFQPVGRSRRQRGLNVADLLILPKDQQRIVNWMLRRDDVTMTDLAEHFKQEAIALQPILEELIRQSYVQVVADSPPRYRVRLAAKSGRQMPKDIWDVLDRNSPTANIFISYSRRNKPFVQRLYDALKKRGREIWVDWESIPSAADWWKEIETGIELADTFVFVLSPASVQSPICTQEINHALLHNKRMIPVVCEDVNPSDVHPELARLNWIFVRDVDQFGDSIRKLVTTLDTDLDYVRMHTRILIRAKEWSDRQQDESFLLRGSDLHDAEQWYGGSGSKVPTPAPLHHEYILASSQAEAARQAAALHQQNVTLKRQRLWLGLITLVSIAAVGLGVSSFWLYQQAEHNRMLAENLRDKADHERIRALTQASEALFDANQRFDALLQSMRAGYQFQAAHSPPPADLQAQVLTALQQAIFWVRERNQLEQHNGIVWDVSYSPDGQIIASASGDRTVRLWRPDGTLLHSLEGHTQPVLGVSFSPDGQLIASASQDQTIKLWRSDGTLITTLTGHSAAINHVRFSPDGQRLISASDDSTVRLWQLDGTPIATLTQHGAAVRDVRFSPDGQLIASASDDQTVRLWRSDGSPLRQLQGHTARVYAIDFSPDGQFLISGSWDHTVRLWRADGTPVRTVQAHDDLIHQVRFSADGRQFATASADKTIKFWRLDGSLVSTLGGHTSQVRSLSFTPDGAWLASAGGDRSIKIWSLDRPWLTPLQSHTGQVYDVEFSPDGQHLATTGADSTIKIWNLDGSEERSITAHDSSIWDLSFSPDGQQLASSSSDWTVKLWNPQTGALLHTLSGHRAPVYAVVFSPDGRWIATASDDQTVRLWTRDGRLVRQIEAHSNGVLTVQFSPDSQTLLTSSWDTTAKLWSLDGQVLQTFKGHSGWVFDAVFSPDGETIATASYDNTVGLWDRQGNRLTTLEGHSDGVVSVQFFPDGIATASADRTLKLWRLDGTLITTLPGHTGTVNNLSFSPDGSFLASASDDRTVLLWHTNVLGNLDELMTIGCSWLQDYLRHADLSESDRQLCRP
ncbi:MAG: TIR domain-containing protein [Leptolyngbya sp. DLM2.Bin15]|nr:MAG: TIR domain-containing protein [Leptolyngbya sp. DLM2.Bin15]